MPYAIPTKAFEQRHSLDKETAKLIQAVLLKNFEQLGPTRAKKLYTEKVIKEACAWAMAAHDLDEQNFFYEVSFLVRMEASDGSISGIPTAFEMIEFFSKLTKDLPKPRKAIKPTFIHTQ